MSGRKGLRRARVLLALDPWGASVARLSTHTGLVRGAVEGVLVRLQREGLAQQVDGRWSYVPGPEYMRAQTEAWAAFGSVIAGPEDESHECVSGSGRGTVPATPQPASAPRHRCVSEGANLPGSLRASQPVREGR